MRPFLSLILALLIPMAAWAKDIAPNTGDIKLNSNINMHVIVGDGVGCAPGYNWNTTYGGCRMHIGNLEDKEFDICRPEDKLTGTRARSRFREQWALQGSGHIAVSPWGNWGAWNESGCRQFLPPCQPHECANRAYLYVYTYNDGSGGGEGSCIMCYELLYVQVQIFRDNNSLIHTSAFVGLEIPGHESLNDERVHAGINDILHQLRSWGHNATIDYSSTDMRQKSGWARVNYH